MNVYYKRFFNQEKGDLHIHSGNVRRKFWKSEGNEKKNEWTKFIENESIACYFH